MELKQETLGSLQPGAHWGLGPKAKISVSWRVAETEQTSDQRGTGARLSI